MNTAPNAFRRLQVAARSVLSSARWAASLQAGALACLVLLAGCDELHPRDTLAPVADSGAISAWFYRMLLGLDAFILLIVVVAMVFALVKFRRKPGDDVLPEQSFGNIKLEVAWTVIPTIIVVAITVPTLGGIFELAKKPDPNQKLIEVEVTGKQWWWDFDYKREGINTANELHVEVGTQVALHMTSSDVIHSWWVPRIGGKRDATPGRTQPMYFKAREVGIFDGQCADLCGASHALMGTRIIVHAKTGPDSYDKWVEHVRTPARKPVTAQEEAGLKVFMTKGCTACHSIQGVAELASGARTLTTGPNLTHVGMRTGIAANALRLSNPVGTVKGDAEMAKHIAQWVKDPQALKPGALMTNMHLTDQEAADVAAYLTSLK